MKVVVLILCVLLSLCLARPQVKDRLQVKEPIPIISLENNVNFDGSYNYGYESGDGTKAQQSGEQKVIGPEPDKAGEVSQGSFTFTGDDGKTYSVTYTADENGFIPQGEHLPTSPPVPEPIARAVQYLLSLPPPKPDSKP